jgi:hypothetical protein
MIGLVHFTADRRQQPFLTRFIQVHGPDSGDLAGHLVHQVLVVGRDELAAVLVVYFFAIVRGQVVAGRKHAPGNGTQVADGKREFRGAAGAVEQVHLDAVGRVDPGRRFGQLPAVQVFHRVGPVRVVAPGIGESAHIVGQHQPARFGRLALGLDQVLAVPLGRCLDGPRVDAVGANPHQSPPAAGAEGDHLIE